MIRLVIADDHPVVRAGLGALLSAEEDIEVIAEAATADDAVAAVEGASPRPDIVLMDLRFGEDGGTGADATRRILALPDPPYVLVLTNYDTDADILGAVEAGASGYLLKDAPPNDLVAAVRAAAAGESAIAPVIAGRLMQRMRTPTQRMSLRETEVLTLVARGLSNAEIAGELYLSEATVKSHLVRIFTKLGVSSRTAAVSAARDQGIIA